jgi:hypothetical protein
MTRLERLRTIQRLVTLQEEITGLMMKNLTTLVKAELRKART